MTKHKPNLMEMLLAERAAKEKLLMDDLERRMDGEQSNEQLKRLLADMCQAPADADLLAWGDDDAGARRTPPRLSKRDRDKLSEPLATPRKGLSDEKIFNKIVESKPTPEQYERLTQLFDRELD